MLTLESILTVGGYTVFRDFADHDRYYYLPRDQARVSEQGRSLDLVVYTDDVSGDPDFSAAEDRNGAFMTLEVELGPDPAELEALRSALGAAVGGAQVRLAQVPFISGTVTLFVLGSGGAGGAGGPAGFQVSVAGSTKPSLFGRQNAVFSVRLGGKAAELLYESLRRSADPQAVVAYSLEFLALRPAYNLEVEIDFKETFDYSRKRLGVNALVAKADIDILTQELINTGRITIKEIDSTGNASGGSPIAGEGGN